MELGQELGNNLIKNMLNEWIKPEVEKRQLLGLAETPFTLKEAQVVFPPEDNTPAIIRLNDEVRYTLVNNEARLIPEEESYGHMTYYIKEGQYALVFDFRYFRDVSKDQLYKADQFISTAQHALEQGHINAVIENLFGVYEFIALSLLVQNRNYKDKTHKTLANKINLLMRQMTNFDPRFIKYFNILSDLRPKARFATNKVIKEYDFAEIIQVAIESKAVIGRNL